MPSQKCRTAQECGPNALCSNGLCVLKCTTSEADCLPNEVCKGGKCTRICSSNDQCGEGSVCINRMCVAGCLTSSECKSNEVCDNNQCKGTYIYLEICSFIYTTFFCIITLFSLIHNLLNLSL
jgi:hypothetical protein